MRKSFGSLFCLLMVVALSVPLMGVAAAPATSPAPARTSAKTTTTLKQSATGLYIVELDDQPLAIYDGGVQGLSATSLRATGGSQLDTESSTSRAYRTYLASKRQNVLRAVQQVLGSRPQVAQTYDVAYNGMALRLTLAQAQKLQSLPGIKQVIPDTIQQLQTDAGPAWIGAAQPGPEHRPALFKATINGAQENPPTGSTAIGAGVFTYDAASKTLMYRISYSGLTGPATLAHIHKGPVGVNGPVLFNILPNQVAPGAIIGTATLTATSEQQLYDEGLYVNIHTADNPGGEIRGQIVPNQGEGMIVGIIDTGINFTHKSFAATGADGYTVQNPLGAGNYKGACDPANGPVSADNPSGYNPAIICNSKLIGAWTFAATADSPSPIGEPSPADDDEHGSHTGSTAAGNIVTSTITFPSGVITDTGTIGGVAPHANIIAYDVCDTDGCFTSAIIGAIDQATKDKVNVINYSIGSASSDPYDVSSPDAIAFLFAFNAGIVASVSAGNSGPDPETIGSPSNAPWVMSVAASTHNRVYRNKLTDYSGGNTPPPDLLGKGFSVGTSGALPIVYAGATPYNNALCAPFAAGTDLSGLIVVCDRGKYGRVEKAQNVAAAGGAGYVLANDEASGNSLNGDVYPIPGVNISYDDGVVLKAWLASGTGQQARITGAYKDASPSNGDIMAGFSSRGPDLTAFDILKPDVAAPGVDILAAVVNSDPNSDEFGFLSGTSMAAPHNAGAMALIRELHPDWTPNEVFSAMMTTAVTNLVLNDDGTPAGPFDRGSGRIDVSNAAMAGLVLNETAQNYAAADPLEAGVPRDLNRASMLNSACVVTCTFTRTFRSTLPVTTTWNATTAVTTGLNLTVEPASFTIEPGASQTVTITADVTAATLGEYAFSALMLTDANSYAPDAHLPIVVQASASNLQDTLQITSDAAQASTKIEGVKTIAISDLKVNVYGLTKATFARASVAQDSDNSDAFDDLSDGISISSIDVPTGTARFVTEVITTTAEDLDMYVALDGSGATPADGIPQEDEVVCTSATGSALERCDLQAPDVGRYFVLVQNWQASEAGIDTFTLSNGVVPAADAGNMTVTGPTTQVAGQPFDLTVAWNVPRMPGDRWYGAFDLGTAPANAGNLGYTTVDLISKATPRLTYLPIIGK